MPAPSTVVTFYDTDGDEFPIRLWGSYESREAEGRALALLEDEVRTGNMNPSYPVALGTIQHLN